MDDFRTFLISRQVLSESQLAQILGQQQNTSDPLYYNLLRAEPSLEGPVWQGLADFLHTDLLDADQVNLDPGLARILPARLAHRFSILPLSRQGDQIEIALADPRQFDKCDELALLIAQHADGNTFEGTPTVLGRLARPSDIAKLIRLLYGIGAETVADMLESDQTLPIQVAGPEVVELTQADDTGQDVAIIRFVNELLLEAVRIGASDIHIEPFEKELIVRYRVDGMLQKQPVPDRIKHLEAAIISRIKIMSHLDIAEKRLPQDGQIRLTVLGRPVDVRVSVLPTVYGQGLALRILDRQTTFRRLDLLGMPQNYLELYREGLKLSHGVVLVTGPTGSGKTTTLYGSISEISNNQRKIITVEDPVEYQLHGITQVQVKPSIDLTFANVLRNIVRHDPDVIMVGEIRDSETAKIAVSAAMTGHLVFSTLHTNDAPSAPVRLLEMGVEPFLISSALEVVVAQRLVRLLCARCRVLSSLVHNFSDIEQQWLQGKDIYEAQGCPACRSVGYVGRTAIFEMFTITPAVREMILARSGAPGIRDLAVKQGMRTLHESGLEKVAAGLTSLSEVYRVAREETIDMQSLMKRHNYARTRSETTDN